MFRSFLSPSREADAWKFHPIHILNLQIRISYRDAPAAAYRYVVDSLSFGSYHENFPEIHIDRSGEAGPGSRRGAKVRPNRRASCSQVNWLANPFPTPPQKDHFRRLPMPSSHPLSSSGLYSFRSIARLASPWRNFRF